MLATLCMLRDLSNAPSRRAGFIKCEGGSWPGVLSCRLALLSTGALDEGGAGWRVLASDAANGFINDRGPSHPQPRCLTATRPLCAGGKGEGACGVWGKLGAQLNPGRRVCPSGSVWAWGALAGPRSPVLLGANKVLREGAARLDMGHLVPGPAAIGLVRTGQLLSCSWAPKIAAESGNSLWAPGLPPS